MTGRQVVTEEEAVSEKESLTDEEKAKLLVDAFGKMCQDEAPQKKRAKRDLDPSSISFLVRQMKCEIERIPAHEKNALMEAQTKCSSDEFSDARLEKFLRCEGMNAQVCCFAEIELICNRLRLLNQHGATLLRITDGCTTFCNLLEMSARSLWS